jgi:hypothetical protein
MSLLLSDASAAGVLAASLPPIQTLAWVADDVPVD